MNTKIVRGRFLYCSLTILLLSVMGANAQTPYKPESEFVVGGQFKDLIMAMPIHDGLESEGIWGGPNVLPRDVHNGVEDSEWCYWGGNPIRGNDGSYHLAVCRWKEDTGHKGWFYAEIAHCISENPMGPYKVLGTIIPEEGINPEILKLHDGRFILHVSGGKIFTSDEVAGPWKLEGTMEIDTRGYKALSHLYTNLTGVSRSDGSVMFFTKRGDVVISNNGLLGPYRMVSAHNYSRYSGYPEDPVIWKSRHQYHVLYNHAVDKKSQHMRSLDGIHWTNESGGSAYDGPIFRYADGTQNDWYKRERPKVLQDEYGRATHLSLAVIGVRKRDDLGNDSHSSKNTILPLVVERLITVVNKHPIDSKTSELKLLIESEEGFDPQEMIDVDSLRLGSADVVNRGGGAKAIKAKRSGESLLLTFAWEGQQLSTSDYDLKLIGKMKSKELIFGYALLPSRVESPASLVTVPISYDESDGDQYLVSAVENWGLKSSEPTIVKVFSSGSSGRTLLKEVRVPTLQPYERFDLVVPVSKQTDSDFQLAIGDFEDHLWTRVDDDHYTISYNGDWTDNPEVGEEIYGESEKIVLGEGASVAYCFNGTQARAFGSINRKMGSADVYIDGHYIETIDCFFTANVNNAKIYETPVLPAGLHKLELRMTGRNHYPEKESAYFSVDGFSFR